MAEFYFLICDMQNVVRNTYIYIQSQ